MTTILCKLCTTQIRDKAADHELCEKATDQQYHTILAKVFNTFNEELSHRQPYPLFQVKESLVCQPHFFDPEADIELFDEWLDDAYREALK